MNRNLINFLVIIRVIIIWFLHRWYRSRTISQANNLSYLFFRLCLILLSIVSQTSFAQAVVDQGCDYNITTFNGQFIKSVKLQHPSTAKFSWESVRGTSNLTMHHTKDLIMAYSFENDTLVVKFSQKSGSGCGGMHQCEIILTTLIIAALFVTLNGRTAFFLTAIFVLLMSGMQLNAGCSSTYVHFKVPFDYAEKICVNNKAKCIPVKCQLSYLSSVPYSNVPSTNKILFKDEFCALKKPEHWDKWTQLHFGTNKTSDQYYIADFDKDGLVNILEYYGDISLENMTKGTMPRTRRSVGFDIKTIGTNPNNADTDGDLLLDGFEYSNQMSPVKQDDRNADKDNDGLSNLSEQIYETNPSNPDTDGDGVNDGTEVTNKADPKDPSDGGKEDTSLQTALVRLTIGDPSGSHSERYVINVGNIAHQSPGYGIVGSGEYKFKPGTYKITINHVGTNLQTPDYDYRALVSKVSGKAKVVVNDPKGILGDHYESNSDYTKGKSATMVVDSDCAGSSRETECVCLKSCEACNAKTSCIWATSFCRKKRLTEYVSTLFSTSCACKKCEDWYNGEKADLNWLRDLNTNFKCPCRAQGTIYLSPVDNSSNQLWEADLACMAGGLPLCWKFHKGAYGCIRSKQASSFGARQQCCYDSSRVLVKPGLPGAGTPDRSAEYSQHQDLDVAPYNWCCKDCKSQKHCSYYINDLRKGDDSHCT